MNVMLPALIFGHCMADYPLQGEFLAKAKNRSSALLGIPWWEALAAHAIIQGGVVALITRNVWLGIAETVVHFVIDDAKCRGKLTFSQDQVLHVVCKIAWVLILWRLS